MAPKTFENVKKKWHPEFIHHCPGTPVIVVGTKLNLRKKQDVLNGLKQNNQSPITSNAGLKLAKKIGAAKCLECSALTQEGFKNVYDEAMRVVLRKEGCAETI